ncbi:MAG: SDR family oxidoreductase, partial [Gemmatimonadaceae bacterium]
MTDWPNESRPSPASAYWGAYAVSKTALEMLVKIYAVEIARTRVRANLIDPGPLRTRLRAIGFPHEDRARLRLPEDATAPFVRLAAAECDATGTLVTLAPGA